MFLNKAYSVGLGAISRMVLMGKVKTTIGTKVMKIVNLEGDRMDVDVA